MKILAGLSLDIQRIASLAFFRLKFKHFDKLNLYLKQQNCPCLQN